MAIRLRRQRDGQSWRPFWYGDFMVDGKSKTVNLNVKWRGIPPGSIRESGDAEFERSRTKAEVELQRIIDEVTHKGRAEHLTERLIKSKTGKSVEYVKIADLAPRWRNLERSAPASERHLVACDSVFSIFATFMQERHPIIVFLYEITKEDAAAWMRKLQGGYSAKTASEYHRLVRSAVNRFLPTGCESPFSDIANARRSNGEVIHRKPFSPDELKCLLDTARNDPFLYPLVVTAACTGMRRGDVCKLRWESVNLSDGMLTVKTSKSGAMVEIPIFAPLMAVLEGRKKERKGYVFPDAVEMLEMNPTGLSWRFKALVAKVLGGVGAGLASPRVSAAEIESKALQVIRRHTTEGARRERMTDIFRRYATGQSVRQIEKDSGICRSTVSCDLTTIEQWVGEPFKRSTPGRHTKGQDHSIKSAIVNSTQVEAGSKRCNAGSVWDWHALRATWVTLALSAGVPIELVRRVTGHATVEVVLQHYFRPGREQFRSILTDAMPSILTGSKKTAMVDMRDELASLVARISDGNATVAEKVRFKTLAAQVA